MKQPGWIVIVGGVLLALLGATTPVAQQSAFERLLGQPPLQETETALPRPTLTPLPRPTLTPIPTQQSRPEKSPSEYPDIRWSQAAALIQNPLNQSILMITVRGLNAGKADGSSDAVLYYNGETLRLLDVLPTRTNDWVRERDDVAGTLTLSLGQLTSSEQVTMQVRFLVLRTTTTTIRLIRTDGRDRANPLFLNLESSTIGPIRLTTQQNGATITIAGRGYKPGEKLAVWANTRQNRAVAIEGEFTALTDDDGSINLAIPFPEGNGMSIVVYGQLSDVTGIADIGQLP